MTHRTMTASLAATMILLLAACGGDVEPEEGADPTSSAPASPSSTPSSSPSDETPATEEESPEAPEPVTITIEGFEYSDPGPVAPGSEITVENLDDAAHTVTTLDSDDFDLTVAPGETATFTAPAEPGEYPYVCSFHANMTATLVVG